MTDDRRPVITDGMKYLIEQTFALVPPGNTGAFIAIVDEHGPRLHVAHKINDQWKVGGAIGRPWGGAIEGSVFIEGTW